MSNRISADIEELYRGIDKEKDKEYLSRKLLDVKYDITENRINIGTTSTAFIVHKKAEKLRQEKLLALYSQIVQECRKKKVKIHYTNHYKKKILDDWAYYSEVYKKYCEDYDLIYKIALEVKKRGIHMGFSDDQMIDYANIVNANLDRYFWRNQIMFQMSAIYTEFTMLYSALKTMTEKSRIVEVNL